MTKNLIVAVVLFAGLAITAVSANACDPKQDPGCNRNAEAAAAPAPCDPKNDPGCD
jgi:hypothetical protein